MACIMPLEVGSYNRNLGTSRAGACPADVVRRLLPIAKGDPNSDPVEVGA